MLLSCLLACTISEEKSAFIYNFVSFFSWLLLTFSLLRQFEYDKYLVQFSLYFLCLGFSGLGYVGLSFSSNLENDRSLFLNIFVPP